MVPRTTTIVFVLVFLFVFWLVGPRLVLFNNDEGIYLDAARRVAQGDAPYKDFFYLSGPGTPWLIGACLNAFGEDLPSARIPVAVDIALMAALVFWMTRRLESYAAAWTAAVLFTGFSTSQLAVILPNHRWDSAAAALAAIVLTWHCRESQTRTPAIGAGLTVAAAAWATPPVALAGAVLCLWFLFETNLRKLAPWFFGAGLAGFLAGLARLSWEGSLAPMIDQMLWIGRNYSGANRMAYGSVIGGYGALLKDTAGIETAITLLVLFFFTIPAWLPIIAAVGWPVRLKYEWNELGDKRFAVLLLLTSGAALLAAQAPRLDLPHLLFASPIFYALTVSLAAAKLPPRGRFFASAVFLVAAGTAASFATMTRASEQWVNTRVGPAVMNAEEARWLAAFESRIERGDTLFAFPYMPVFYTALDARNPTRYSFLQPGMSSESDERAALTCLEGAPPRWIIYLPMSASEYLRIWPSSDRTRLRLNLIEDFIGKRYDDAGTVGPYRLKRLRD